jgi:hypothetical protein
LKFKHFIINYKNYEIMRILLFTLLIAFSMISSLKAQVIFDPATYDPSKLPNGMTIVELDGSKYIQIVLDGWNSAFEVDSALIETGKTHFVCKVKYAVGSSGFELNKINTFLKLINTTEGEVAASGSASSDVFKNYKVTTKTGEIVKKVQIAGQETTGWLATVGDTLWVGKIFCITNDPDAILDPNTLDPDALPSGMSIVEIGGVKYLQTILNEWNSSIPVDPFEIKAGKTHFRVKAKYAVGSSGFEIGKINTFLKLATADWVEIAAKGVTSDAVFTAKKIEITPGQIVGNVQVGGQETTGWSAVVGDTLWIGKIRAITNDPLAIFDPAEADPSELPSSMSIVTISDTKYLKVALNEWNTSLTIDPFITPARILNSSCMVKYEVGTSGFELSKINTFLKFTTVDWVEIVASGSASSAEFIEYKLNLTEGNTIENFQMAGQETTGWSAVAGDFLYIGKVSAVLAPETAPITFIVDDSNLKTSTGFGLKGSWNTATGAYDVNWNDGAEQTQLFDDGTHGDKVAGDHIWSVTLDLIVDAGANSWEWGLNDSKGNWVLVGANQKFTLPDAKAQTLTYSNTVSVNNLNASKIKVYPNPASDMITIIGSEIKSVEIFNLVGAKVLLSTINSQSVNVSSLKSGSYIIKANTLDGNTIISRFSKNQ